jgi:hypothetical protein
LEVKRWEGFLDEEKKGKGKEKKRKGENQKIKTHKEGG